MYIMQSDRNTFKRVFLQSSIDCKDDIEEKLEKARTNLNRLVGNASEREAHDILTSAACRDTKTHEDICLGLLATILTDQFAAPKCFRDLTLLTRDSLKSVIDCLITISLEKYQKLTDVARAQLVYLVRELVRAGINNVDSLCFFLMRQIAGGDISNRNLWLAENVLDIYLENRSWLEKYPMLIASVIYTYLRILEDHTTQNLANLKQKEVNFLVGLIRDHFTDVCMNQQLGLGRDFLRLLQSVSRIPEIESLWKDIYGNPNSLGAQLTGVHQLMSFRTSRKYLQSRLTPDMEKKIYFLTSSVRFGSQKRYQDWFQRQYLSTPESQTLRADIIRFIVGVIHPSNEILCSDILPRWAVIGWLLTTCTHPVAAANAKLALFFDWLVFDPSRDNIMNIEPGILVMFHSLRPHPAITATLLDFLIRLTIEYWPAGADKIKDGIGSALREIVDKKVLASLDMLLENQKLDNELRSAVQTHLLVLLDRKDKSLTPTKPGVQYFDNATYSGLQIQMDNNTGNSMLDIPHMVPSIPLNSFGGSINTLGGNALNNNNNSEVNHEQETKEVDEVETELNDGPDFSDEGSNSDNSDNEETSSVNHLRVIDNSMARNSPTMAPSSDEVEKSKIDEIVQGLSPGLRINFVELLNDVGCDRVAILDDILDEYTDQTVDASERQVVVKCLTYVYKPDLLKQVVTKDSTSLVENLSLPPLGDIVSRLMDLKQNDRTPKRKNLLKLLADMINYTPQLGYRLLLVLDQMSSTKQPGKEQDAFFTLYKTLCQYRSLKLDTAIIQDLKMCWEYEPLLIGSLCPVLYAWYETETVGSHEILRIVVSALDPNQLQENVWKIMHGDFIIIDDDSLVPLLNRTLDWETWEQHCVWTLITAHDFEPHEFLPLIPQLDSKTNAEALTYLLLTLKHTKPTGEVLGPLFCRKPSAKDRFVISLLLHWSDKEEDEELLAENLVTVLVCASGSPTKRKRGATGGRGTASPAGPTTPTMESVLAHLDQFRQALANTRDDGDTGVFSKDIMQAALLQIQSWVTDTQKNKYKELLELAAAEPDMKSSSRAVPKRNSSNRNKTSSPTPTSLPSRTRSGKTKQSVKYDSEGSSEDDDPRPKKRKKPALVSSSDSD